MPKAPDPIEESTLPSRAIVIVLSHPERDLRPPDLDLYPTTSWKLATKASPW